MLICSLKLVGLWKVKGVCAVAFDGHFELVGLDDSSLARWSDLFKSVSWVG